MAGRCFLSRAPGKVILFGEHFVVEGVPAIASAVSLYTSVKVCESERESVEVYSKLLDAREVVWPRCSGARMCFLGRVVEHVASSLGVRPRGATASVESTVPVAAGMGSSAALSTAFAAAYMALLSDGGFDEGVVLEAAYRGEEVVHGRPSGIDNAVAVYGGYIVYERRREIEIRRITGAPRVQVVIADSGIKRRTRDAVMRVLENKERLGRLGELLYEYAAVLVQDAEKALVKGDLTRLGLLMNVNHGLLNALGVSLPELEILVYTARNAGAYGAKITGAGLGGSIIALVDENKAGAVIKALKRIAARVYSVELGASGVSVEEPGEVV